MVANENTRFQQCREVDPVQLATTIPEKLKMKSKIKPLVGWCAAWRGYGANTGAMQAAFNAAKILNLNMPPLTRTAWVQFLPAPTHYTCLCCSAKSGLMKLACLPPFHGG